MITLTFNLSLEQSYDNKDFFDLQTCLPAAGIFLDLGFKDGSPQLTLSVPEVYLSAKEPQSESQDTASNAGCGEESAAATAPDLPKHKGRPAAQPKEDLTLGRVRHMRFMGVSVEKIAECIGVSKRTFYRRYNQISQKNLDEDTPFSQWDKY